MKDNADLVRSWLRKADSDPIVVKLALDAEDALDTACFHAQQAPEKVHVAYMVAYGRALSYRHNLSKLLILCGGLDPEFDSPGDEAKYLTPFAVELRYDNNFWPSTADVEAARDLASKIRSFALQRLPAALRTGSP